MEVVKLNETNMESMKRETENAKVCLWCRGKAKTLDLAIIHQEQCEKKPKSMTELFIEELNKSPFRWEEFLFLMLTIGGVGFGVYILFKFIL